jgi:hypothetical protein
LRLLPVMLIHIQHQRGDRPVPTVRADLVQPKAGLLPEFRGLRDGRVT